MNENPKATATKTIADFGEQWTLNAKNEGYYASLEMLRDILGPLLPISAIEGSVCAEIGSGTGRITNMLANSGAGHITSVEPSAAVEVLRKNVAVHGDKIAILHQTGEDARLEHLDYAFSIGVLHHIPEPKNTVDRMFSGLKPGGKAIVWLYGREGNSLYLSLVLPMRKLTQRFSVRTNMALSWALYLPLAAYIWICHWIPLPMHSYMRRVLAPLSGQDTRLVILDQLNPAWAKYYTMGEARRLLEDSGFVDVRLHHRHAYSWTVIGTKPT